jgi:hypothetical protein
MYPANRKVDVGFTSRQGDGWGLPSAPILAATAKQALISTA